MKRFPILSVLLLVCMAGKLHADTYVYVGSWEVDQGPFFGDFPPAYSGQQAAALLFGDSPSDYVISTVSNQVADINDSNWISTYSGAYNLGIPGCETWPCGTVVADDYVVSDGGLYDQEGDTSAYVYDNAVDGAFSYTNYAFVDESTLNSPVPEPSSLLLLGSGILGLTCLMRRKRMA